MLKQVSRPRARRAAPALVLLAWFGPAEAAPPAGKPVFIHVQGMAPSSVAQNGFMVGGDFTEGGAFYWMPSSGVTLVGGEDGRLSRDGSTMVGSILDANRYKFPARWEGGRSWRILGPLVPGAIPCETSYGIAFGASGDGRVVVGSGYYGTSTADPCAFYSAYRWEESTGYVLMPSPSGDYTRAHAISADGHVIVGIDAAHSGPWRGAKWTDGRYELIQGPLGNVVSAWAVNNDGTLIAGSGCTVDLPDRPPTAWSWTAASGVRCHTAEPPRWVTWVSGNNYNNYIRAVSDDGRVMGGDVEFNVSFGEQEAVVWFDGEAVYLRDYLRDHGYPTAFAGHVNSGRITGVSPDGRVLVGYNGGPFGAINLYGFIVILPELSKR